MVQFLNTELLKGFWKLFNFICKQTWLGQIKLSRWQIFCRTKPSDPTWTETQGIVLGPNHVQTFLASLLQRESVASQAKKHRHGMSPKLYLIYLVGTDESHPNPLQNCVHLSKGVLMFANHATQIKMSKKRDSFPLSNSPCLDTSSKRPAFLSSVSYVTG